MSMDAESLRLVLFQKVHHHIPRSASAIYKGHHLKRLPWLTRINPEGLRDGSLWVQVEVYDRWAAPRGLPLLSQQLDREARAL
ncbi:MAG: hypothetical protein H3C29_08225 [Simplicispira suum]|uniref:hypothetical protein n=1 Tax=Simplicispira suum TaxID=2109915 RepID=UPI001C6ADF00|nr:hypothetical protein [Simplicispira suum]MBW7833189.1 hypothetical protein [Simplicispira suum]